MSKWKRLIAVLAGMLFLLVLIWLSPSIGVRIFGNEGTRWIGQRLSETLREKNELVVYEVEITGIETVTQEAWLIGTVQKVELPYTFQMRFSVDLSNAKVTADGTKIRIEISEPVAGYEKLTIDEAKMRKSDWLYPLTPQRYEEITQALEEKLLKDASANPEYQKAAWEHAVRNLENLFSTIADQHIWGEAVTVEVVPASNL